ncbi:alpha/beta-hydrolase [Xylona heveae TC161]|uniref:Alpha/beta-hydrolase n=1 Tax=Xylona heveae (strain CBS 132557 / TC161) TaxID=1328760 RepID=A0A165H1N6_XYLHT|nr:alpha/beta-hydrolase [Xylona heveae TC161]KZF22872.1 alpha/beta-hydrolase [Xylona heveae TC161]
MQHHPEIHHVSKDPGHPYAVTRNISFDYFDQSTSSAPFGYEHYVSLPPSYDSEPAKQWPLILFLHGAGESQRGANESYVSIRHGIPKIILCYDRVKSGMNPPSIQIPLAPRLLKRNPNGSDLSSEPVPEDVCNLVAERFITVTPSLNMEWGYGWNNQVLSSLLDEIVQSYRVDVDRVHVTGFSMGGYGTWKLAMQTPERFASLVPVCGGGDSLRVKNIRHVPQWVHHGDLDDIIPVRQSQEMVKALQKAGAPDVRFTRHPDATHDSWTNAYNNVELFKWMLAQRRQVKGEEIAIPEDDKIQLS